MLPIPGGRIDDWGVGLRGERNLRARIREVQHSQVNAQRPIIQALERDTAAVAGGIPQADQPVVITIGQARRKRDVPRPIAYNLSKLPLRGGRRDGVVLLSANDAV